MIRAPRLVVVASLGVSQVFAWGSTYYLPAVLAGPILAETGWPLARVIAGLSLGLLVAAVVSPRVGKVIERRGGRPVLAASAVILALGLVGLALARDQAAYFAAWAVLGVGMGAGLYDPAFSTLGRLYGLEARRAISLLTLFGGFSATICWPLWVFFESRLGWRDACLAYAAIHLLINLPLYWFGVPEAPPDAPPSSAPLATAAAPADGARRRLHLALFAPLLTSAALVTTILSVHLLTLLQARGLSLEAAVGYGALIGPCQVAARLIEMLMGRRHHPIWTLLVSSSCVALGLAALASGLSLIAPALMLYGAGIGLHSIARSTLPLTLFGAKGYATLMGRLSIFILVASAGSPAVGAASLDHLTAPGTLIALAIGAALNLGLSALLGLTLARGRSAPAVAG